MVTYFSISVISFFVRVHFDLEQYLLNQKMCEQDVLDYERYKLAMIRKRRNQKEIPTLKTEVGKTKLTIRYLLCRKPIEQLFPNRLPLNYPNLNKNMKTYKSFKHHKNSTPKHKTNGTTTEVLPWNDQ